MTKYDLAIIGGGISGLSAALILSSGIKEYSNLNEKTIAIIDSGGSDALKARFFNAPGTKQGISGKKALRKLREQVQSYGVVTHYDNRVKEISKESNKFKISYGKENELFTEKILLSTGFRSWNIKGIELPLKQFTRTTNTSRVAMNHIDYRVEENIYVCGLLSDVSSQYPIVAGTGAQAAINIMFDWTGEWIVIHDK